MVILFLADFRGETKIFETASIEEWRALRFVPLLRFLGDEPNRYKPRVQGYTPEWGWLSAKAVEAPRLAQNFSAKS